MRCYCIPPLSALIRILLLVILDQYHCYILRTLILVLLIVIINLKTKFHYVMYPIFLLLINHSLTDYGGGGGV